MIQKLNIPRSIWDRGKGTSKLLRDGGGCEAPPRQQCCIGILCTQLGYADHALRRHSALLSLNIESTKKLSRYLDAAVDLFRPYMGSPYADSSIVAGLNVSTIYKLYGANDRKTISEKTREETITALFRHAGMQVNIFDEEIDFGI